MLLLTLIGFPTNEEERERETGNSNYNLVNKKGLLRQHKKDRMPGNRSLNPVASVAKFKKAPNEGMP